MGFVTNAYFDLAYTCLAGPFALSKETGRVKKEKREMKKMKGEK